MNFQKNGYAVIKRENLRDAVADAKEIFETTYQSKFSKNPLYNRELIKRFADHPSVASLFASDPLIDILRKVIGFDVPVMCGPAVTHYTSNDLTGAGFGLGYHQDYPSMGSSKESVICWFNLVDADENSHGVELMPGMHRYGLLNGTQTSKGYVLHEDVVKENKSIVPTITAGDLLIMSSFLPHRTYVNPTFDEWKLSLSQRFDDLSDDEWASRGYKNAYGFSVDRELYLKS